ncbi:MAG: acyltransferase [Hydrogenophaga sp.]|uniref:acyltransferase family protein n=1 Tax=Hydrogenophaga sp. TaxID=1904254 RepID=UPI002AB8C949|nr:acyltransferase [Hydrogenophaga sp.]MDZ4187675.1 acyltransferase [Hydrogenophaga sp.]
MRYWASLDGLRGLAVAAVMLFHAQVSQVKGGFLGVDIFFVLSGFLISSQLLRELSRTGRVRWGSFFMRRLVRLQPALALLLLVYALGWVAGLVPGPGTVVARDVATVLLAMAHWARAFDWYPPDYLGHAWSLGIEEQFYLLWALLLASLGAQVARPGRVFLLAVVCALASMLWMLWLQTAGAGPVRLYNGLDTRAMALLCGCALAGGLHTCQPQLLDAAAFQPFTPKAQHVASFAGLGALGLLLWAMVNADWRAATMFPWGYMAAALLSALLVWSVVVAPTGRLPCLLAWRPFVFLGKISYGLYLWHYPLFRVAEAQAPKVGLTFANAMVLAACLSLLAAWASLVWVERPLRQRLSKSYRLSTA